MLTVLSLLLPVYLLVAMGFGVVRTHWVGGSEMASLGRLVLRVFIPATLFYALSSAPLHETLRLDYLAAYAGGSVGIWGITFVLSRLLGNNRADAGLEAMGASVSNSAYFGLPVVTMVFGADTAFRVFALHLLVENLVTLPLAIGVMETAGGRVSLGRLAATTLRNPLLIASVAGLAYAATGLPLPEPVSRTFQMLNPVAAPVALLVIGAAVAELNPGAMGWAAVRLVPLKLVVFPALVGGLMVLFSVDPTLAKAGVLNAAVPMMSSFALFGLNYGRPQLAATALILNTAVSFFTLTGLVAFLEV
ncbi:AEC family transporter [Rhodobacter lacus]|uniref:AEC family transporter n=1 Tax=Rhodobacter lacus TaxID=1641972 RepID=A0ABW5A6Y0_9RHOB